MSLVIRRLGKWGCGYSSIFSSLTGETRFLFDHPTAQARFGASLFWIRRAAAFGGEEATVEHWGIKRGGSMRGLVEIVAEDL